MATDDIHIRNYARYRDRGEMDRACEEWREVCALNQDLVRIRIRGFQFDSGGRLDRDLHDDAFSETYVRLAKLGKKFEGHTMAEFRALLIQAVWFACMDVGRAQMKVEQRSAGSLDDLFEDSDTGWFAQTLKHLAEDRENEREEAADATEQRLADIELARWVISQVKNESHREVLELTYLEGLSGEVIAERIGESVANVYQRRTRGLNEVRKILHEQRP